MTTQNDNEIKYCAITEQGDLGLGAEVLKESDQELMKKAEANKTTASGQPVHFIKQIVIG